MTVKGNGGDLIFNKKAHVNGFGTVWFDDRAITNILSFGKVVRKYQVSYDCSNGSVFTMHKPDGRNIHFAMHKDGLHYHDSKNQQVTLVSTVAENEKGYSQHQLE